MIGNKQQLTDKTISDLKENEKETKKQYTTTNNNTYFVSSNTWQVAKTLQSSWHQI